MRESKTRGRGRRAKAFNNPRPYNGGKEEEEEHGILSLSHSALFISSPGISLPDNPGYPLPVFTLRYPLSHSTPLSPSCDHVPATPCVDHPVVSVTSFPRRRPTHSVPVPPLPRPSPSSPFVLPPLLVSVAFSHRNFLSTASSVMNSIPYASYRNPSHFISLSQNSADPLLPINTAFPPFNLLFLACFTILPLFFPPAPARTLSKEDTPPYPGSRLLHDQRP